MAGRTGTKGVPRAEREAQILHEAVHEFAAVGYQGASLPRIARRCGVSKPMVYQYFGSKERLYLTCVEHAGAVIVGEVERVAGLGEVGVARGLATIAGLAEALDGRPHLWPVLFDRTVPPGTPAALAALAHVERLERLAVEGVGEMLALAGDADPVDHEVMTQVWVGMLDTVMRWWAQHPDEPGDAVAARALRIAGALFTEPS